METNLNKYKSDLARLIERGEAMLMDFKIRHSTVKIPKNELDAAKRLSISFEDNYQSWYSEVSALIKQLLPDRVNEFEVLYKGDGKRKSLNRLTITIQDWLLGTRSPVTNLGGRVYHDWEPIYARVLNQYQILESVNRRFESSLFDIKQLLRADLFDSEVDAARELLKKGFDRAAGAIAGVVIEAHFSQVLENHSIRMDKKNPTIDDYNKLLKENDVYEVPTWRFIQRMGDIRNYCDHNKEREPTSEEVSELVDGTEKIIKTIY